MSYEEDLEAVLSGKVEVFHGTACKFDPRMMRDFGIGFWFAQNERWARGYAERRAIRTGNSPQVHSATIVMSNPLYLGNLDDAATDSTLDDIAVTSGVDIDFLNGLRNLAGWSGEELDEPMVFEVVNRREFMDRIRQSSFDGIVAFENGGEEQVFCLFDRKRIRFKISNSNVKSGAVDVGADNHGSRGDDHLGELLRVGHSVTSEKQEGHYGS